MIASYCSFDTDLKKLKRLSQVFDAAFDENGNYRYYNTETGKLSLIEVPKEQWHPEAEEYLQQKLDNAPTQVPATAKELGRGGNPSYPAAKRIALSGSVQSIGIDLTQGIATAIPGASISAIITFGTCMWNGQDMKDAAKMSFSMGVKNIGKSALQHTLTMQLSREYTIFKGFNGGKNPLYGITERSAKSIKSSKLAKSTLGKKVGLNNVTGTKLIAGTVTTAVVFGPDICKAFQGKISGGQLVKNTIVNIAGMVGGAVGGAMVGGATAGVGAVGGAMAGGSLASTGAKKLLDKFWEDDTVIMFRIVREEFLESVMQHSFNKDEFDKIVTETLARKDISQVLQDMVIQKNKEGGEEKAREHIRSIVERAIVDTLSRRQKITNEMYLQGMQELLLEAEAS